MGLAANILTRSVLMDFDLPRGVSPGLNSSSSSSSVRFYVMIYTIKRLKRFLLKQSFLVTFCKYIAFLFF